MVRMKSFKEESGVSLMETLIALFLTGLVVSAVFGAYIDQHKNMMIQDGIMNMQQNARASIDELGRFIRMAGHYLPIGIDPINGTNSNPDTIVITFAIRQCNVVLQQNMSSPADQIRCDGQDMTCLDGCSWAYIFDPDAGGGEFFKIGDIQPAPERIILDTDPLSRAYESGCQVLPIQSIRYFVDNTDSTHPNLMMQVLGEDPVVYAEYVDDLQFQYRLRNGTVVDAPSVPSETREVLLTVVARTAVADSDFPDNPYRHATYASKVNLRNLSTW